MYGKSNLSVVLGLGKKFMVGYERFIHLVHMHSSGLMGDFDINCLSDYILPCILYCSSEKVVAR